MHQRASTNDQPETEVDYRTYLNATGKTSFTNGVRGGVHEEVYKHRHRQAHDDNQKQEESHGHTATCGHDRDGVPVQ